MLTNERIDRMVGRTNWLLLTFANGTQTIALDPVAARNFARAIEAEVLQSQELVGGITPFNPLNAASNVLPCRAQNATHAPQDVLQNADATQAQEPVAKVTVHYNYGPDYKASVEWLTDCRFAPDTLLYAAPQPPAPCPKCAELKGELKDINAALDDPRTDLTVTAVEVIAALQAKVAELEKVAKAYEDQVAAHNKTLDELKYTGLAAAAEARRGDELQSQVAEQAALIEKCEKALQTAFKWGSPMLAAPRSTRPEWIDRVQSTLAAITTYKGEPNDSI